MTLLITVFAAVISTAVWYTHPHAKMHLGMLCWMFWGAALMWTVDAISEYIEDSEALFNPAPADLLNDTYLGLSVVALAAVIWTVTLLVKDPRRVIASQLESRVEPKNSEQLSGDTTLTPDSELSVTH